jgi:hypothetical protein
MYLASTKNQGFKDALCDVFSAACYNMRMLISFAKTLTPMAVS